MSFQGRIGVEHLSPFRFPGGLAQGTNLRTPAGLRRIEILRPGDLVVTRGHGLQPILMIWKRTLTRADIALNPSLAPICLKPRAIGPMMPQRDLLVAPDHRLLIPGFRLAGKEGATPVLAEAQALAGSSDAVFSDTGRASVTYHQLVFANHEIFAAEGLPVASFLADPAGLDALGGAYRSELEQLHPGLINGQSAAFEMAEKIDYLPF